MHFLNSTLTSVYKAGPGPWTQQNLYTLSRTPGIVNVNYHSPTEQESQRTISLHEVVEKSSLHTTQTISAVVSFTRKQLDCR